VSGATVREVEAADLPAVTELLWASGLKPRSRAGWDWLWHGQPEPWGPRGWALELDGRVAGYLGHIGLPGVLDGAPVALSTGADWAVAEPARAEGTRLLRAFFQVPGAAAWISTTANPASAPAYGLFKARSPEAPSFRAGLLWAGDDAEALAAAADRAGLPRPPRALIGPPAAAAGALRRAAGLLHPRPRRWDGEVERRGLDALHDPELHRLWRAQEARGGLHLRREPALLRWMLSDPDGATGAAALLARDRGGLAAVALVARHQTPTQPVSQLRLIDVVLRDPTDDTIPYVAALISAAAAEARRQRAAVVYAPPCHPALHAALARAGGRPVPRDPIAHHLRAAKGLDAAAIAARWWATGIDGDAPLALRSPQRERGTLPNPVPDPFTGRAARP
jgi:hypothetical protein